MTPARLTDKQQRFVEEYLKDLNATRAAIRCGYSAKTARAQGSRLLTNADIAAAVEAAIHQQSARLEIAADQAREQNAFIGLADPLDLVDEQGNLLPLRKMPRRIRCAIRSIEVVKRNVSSGDGQTDTTYKVTLWDKSKAIEMEYKHFGMLVEKLDVSGAITIIHELPE
jgi:phage terminase small subunit